MGQLEGCQKIPKKNSEVRREVIWWCKRYNWHKTIEKSCLSFTVWPHECSTFEEEKKRHEMAIFPVLQKLTHMFIMSPILYVMNIADSQHCFSWNKCTRSYRLVSSLVKDSLKRQRTTATKTILGIVTFEILITILTIENLNSGQSLFTWHLIVTLASIRNSCDIFLNRLWLFKTLINRGVLGHSRARLVDRPTQLICISDIFCWAEVRIRILSVSTIYQTECLNSVFLRKKG